MILSVRRWNHLWPSIKSNCETRAWFHGEFRLLYQEAMCVTKLSVFTLYVMNQSVVNALNRYLYS